MNYQKNKLKEKLTKYLRRKIRTNSKIKSSNPEVRIVINRSNLYVSAQALWKEGKVLARITDKWLSGKTKVERAMLAWEELAKLMKKQKIEKAVFDRNWFFYHGRVKSFVEGLKKGGIVC